MTDWTEFDLTRSLPRLQQRFPKLVVDNALCSIKQGDALIARVASAQGISLTEAREEMRDFLYLESLRAELTTSKDHAALT
ncbi:hypothetical protein [Phaeobacter sp. HF9A]|uniref:hypothetical protein n=1 Tax=Phaeobacter sp. HF9A TaxID=2721561 RepID=UPI00142F7459|nr:hypothetical protein [Phaeobacter sp. HF9A]NIZ12212.1 hypothetical protein [Phaeobacter sp. HF9A]